MTVLAPIQAPLMSSELLETLREQIDQVDRKIILLIRERKEIVSQVMDWKKSSGYPIFDPQREIKIIEKLQKIGEESQIDPQFISKLYELILKDSKKEYL